MPDDDYRPTHGLPPDSRPTNVPPDWWDLLDRNDLPKGGGERDRGPRHRGSRDEDIIRAPRVRRASRPAPGWRLWMTNVALLVVAVLLLTVGLASATPQGIAAILLTSGILVLLALVSIQLARRMRRRG
jgi:hypothetical protein